MATADFENRYDSISEFHQGVAIVIKDGKYGVILMGGHEVIVPSYDYISPFKDGYSKAIKGGETKIIDLSGRECKESNGKIIAIPSKYDIVRDFKGGVACVGITNHHNKTKWGVIDENCNEIFEPQYYFISDFIAGTAKYQKESSQYEDSWGFLSSDGFASECNFKEPEINVDGSLIIERNYQINGYRIGFRQENDDTTPKKVRINNHGQILVNVGSEEIALPKEFRLAKSFAKGLICVQDSTGYWGAIHQNGRVVIPLEYKDLKDFSENKTFGINSQGNLCLISITGDIIKIFDGFIDAESFKNGIAIIKQEDKQALINQIGDILLGPINACISYTNVIGEFRLSAQEKQGLFDSNTGLLIKPQYKKVIKVEKDFVLVEVDEIGETFIDFSGRAFINKESRIYLPDWCLGVKILVDDIYIGISEEGKWGFVDAQGKSLCLPIFDHIGELDGDIIKTENSNTFTLWHGGTRTITKYGLFNKSSRIAISAQYDSCPEYNGSFYKIKNNNLFGAIDLKGKEVLETKWKSVEYEKGYYVISDMVEEDDVTREKYGIANGKGKIVFEPQFQCVIILRKGFFKIKNDFKWMLYNENGIISEDSIDKINSIKNGIITVSVDGHIGYINLNGKKVFLSDKKEYIELPSCFSWGEGFKNGIAKVWINGYENYVNSNFNLVINNNKIIVLDSSVDYLETKDSSNNYVFVSKSQRGLISQDGDILISAKYQSLVPLKSDLYVASTLIDSVEKYGVINIKEKLILPFEYTSINPYGGKVPHFHDDKIYLPNIIEYWILCQDDKYGLINSSAKICINPEYYDIKQFDYGFFVEKGINKWGVINKKFKIITEPKYSRIEVVEDDFYQVSIDFYISYSYKTRSKFGILDKYGREKLEPVYNYVKDNKYNKLPEGRFYINLNGNLGIIDDKYNILAEPVYDKISDFDTNGIAIVEKRINGSSYYDSETIIGGLDVDGNYIALQDLTKLDIVHGLNDNAKVKIVSTLKNDFNVVKKEHSNPNYQYCAIIDQNNDVVLPYKYHEIKEFDNGSFLVKLNDKYGVVDSAMKEIVAPSYSHISLVNNVYIVENTIDANSYYSKKRYYGMIDLKGNILLKCIYSSINPAVSDLFFVTISETDDYTHDKYNLVGLLNSKGEFLIEPKYSRIENFADGYAKVYNGNWGVINIKGKEVLSPIYDSVELNIKSNLFFVSKYLGDVFSSNRIRVSGMLNLDGIQIIRNVVGEFVPASRKYIWQEDYDDNSWSRVYYYNGKIGKVNKNMQLSVSIVKEGEIHSILLSEEYDWGYDSDNCYIIVEKNRKQGVIDEEGKLVIECKYDSIKPVSKDEYVIFICETNNKELSFPVPCKWSILNTDGQNILAREYSEYKLLGNGLIALKGDNNKYSVANFKGQLLTDSIYDYINSFGVLSNLDSYSIAKLRKKYANWKKPQNSSVKESSNSISVEEYVYGNKPHNGRDIHQKDVNMQYAIVQMSGKIGVINKFAQLIIPPKYESLVIMENGTFIVNKDANEDFASEYSIAEEKLINNKDERVVSNGNITISISDEYEDAEILSNGYILVRKGDLFGCINRKGDVVIPIKYEHLSCCGNLFAAKLYDEITKKTVWGAINMSNKLIVPFNESYDEIKIENELILFEQEHGNWGAYSLQGRMICEPKYNHIHRISDNLIKVGKDEKEYRLYTGYYGEDYEEYDVIRWGLIDNNGNEKLPLEYDIDDDVVNGHIKIGLNGRRGFLDLTGHMLLEPTYNSIENFVDGLAIVTKNHYYDDNKKFQLYGVINSSFEEIIPCIYKELEYEKESGLIKTDVGYKTTDGRYIADYNGKYIFIDKKYKYCKSFINNCAISVTVDNGSVFYGLINSKSEDIIPPIFKGLQQVGEGIYRFKLNGKYGLADVKGRILLPNAYDGIGKFVDDLALMVVHDGPEENDNNKLYGYVDLKGSIVLPAEYKFISKRHNEFSIVMRYNVWGFFSYLSHEITIIENAMYLGRVGDGLYKFKIDNKYGLVDAKGNVLLPNAYDGIGKFVEDLALLVVKDDQGMDEKNKLYGYVDSKCSIVLPPKYNYLGKQYNQYVVIMKDNVWGLFSLLNREITTIENATYLGAYLDGLCRINIGGKFDVTTKKVELGSWGYVDVDGQMVIPPQYDRALSFQEGMAAVKKGDGWGFINKEGNIIVPCEYDKVESNYKDGKGELIKDGKVYVFDTDGNIIKSYEEEKYDEYNDYDYDDYSPSYDKYGGYNGYDDQTIDEVFGGDPSLTWNID